MRGTVADRRRRIDETAERCDELAAGHDELRPHRIRRSAVVERWQLDDARPEILAQTLDWQPDLAHAPLVMDLPAYFRDVTGE